MWHEAKVAVATGLGLEGRATATVRSPCENEHRITGRPRNQEGTGDRVRKSEAVTINACMLHVRQICRVLSSARRGATREGW